MPLSESLFFFLSTIILYGIIKNRNSIIFVAVLLSAMTRPVFLFFIPAFVGMALMSQSVEKILKLDLWKKILVIYLLPCLLGVTAVVLFQYFETGKWLVYFDLQSNYWGRAFNYGPTFPLGYRTLFWNLKGSYVSYWIGAFTGMIGLKLLIDWIKGKEILARIKNYELFSVIFICMSLMSILFFNAQWMWFPDTKLSTTHFTGINRYIHPTIFFFVLLVYFFRVKKLSAIQYFGIFIFTNLIWFSFDLEYYKHIKRYLEFLIPTLVVLSLCFYHAFRWKILGYGIILASMILQSVLFNYYLGFVQID